MPQHTHGGCGAALVNTPIKHKRWVNIYPSTVHATREEADSGAARNRIACIEVEFEEGEGF